MLIMRIVVFQPFFRGMQKYSNDYMHGDFNNSFICFYAFFYTAQMTAILIGNPALSSLLHAIMHTGGLNCACFFPLVC